MKTQNINSIKIDKRLERFKGKILFPEQVELAKKMLANVKLPEIPEKNNFIKTVTYGVTAFTFKPIPEDISKSQ